jgi:hypothetical protein
MARMGKHSSTYYIGCPACPWRLPEFAVEIEIHPVLRGRGAAAEPTGRQILAKIPIYKIGILK